MNEPFRVIERNEYPDVPSFSASSIDSEFWATYKGIIDPKPISQNLSDIFDAGNVVHLYDEIYMEGARCLHSCETYIKILHDSELFAISGLHDYIKLDRNGLYIEDLKSTTSGGLYYFFNDKVGKGYITQMSVYKYLYYVKTGVPIESGVITKIDKENTRNRISLEAKLYPISYMRDLLINHPVINTILGNMEVTDLLEEAFLQLKDVDPKWANGTNTEPWVCMNCQYKSGCELLGYIEDEDLHVV